MAKKAEELLCYIFEEILPEHGMSLRENQKELSLEMLRALIENKLPCVRQRWEQERLTLISWH